MTIILSIGWKSDVVVSAVAGHYSALGELVHQVLYPLAKLVGELAVIALRQYLPERWLKTGKEKV